jgi:hypothetical protein
MDGYGGACSCCGETELTFLTTDHVNGDGSEKRRTGFHDGHSGGSQIYRWVIRNGWPKDLQCLCFNCQWGKRLCGVCPHKSRATGSWRCRGSR